ncbi:hypothetical protein B0T14DRAFT_549343 [Immersiella caudata]|uniref:Clr5 domain-containing protein n=1 Tax=Immersiella caudata TaxID=314043 RepID=A0AA39XE93_9PEZI|nr:hypothetical protein B0T14DRAFT_549343 [Immersiella caudata]
MEVVDSTKRWATEEDWARCRTTIKRLYLDENKPLAEVMKIMERKHGLRASEDMYKTRLRAMKLTKNLKSHEALAMARVRASRDAAGLSTEFWRMGRLVENKRLDRYIRLNRAVEQQLEVLRSRDMLGLGPIELPPHIIVLNPSFPVRTPEVLAVPEKMCVAITNYIKSGFVGNRWRVNADPESRTIHDDVGNFWKMEQDLLAGVGVLGRKNATSAAASVFFDRAFAAIQPLLITAHPWTLVALVWRIHFIAVSNRRPELARVLQDYVGKAAAQHLGCEHPWAIFFRSLDDFMHDLEGDMAVSAFEAFSRVVRDQLEAHTGMSSETLGAYTYNANFRNMLVGKELKPQITEGAARALIPRMASAGAAIQCNVMRLELAMLLEDQGRDDEAMALFEDIISAQDSEVLVSKKLDALDRLSQHYSKTDADKAVSLLEESVRFAEDALGPEDSTTIRHLDLLAQRLQRLGFEERAVQVRLRLEDRVPANEAGEWPGSQ